MSQLRRSQLFVFGSVVLFVRAYAFCELVIFPLAFVVHFSMVVFNVAWFLYFIQKKMLWFEKFLQQVVVQAVIMQFVHLDITQILVKKYVIKSWFLILW